MSGHEPAWPTSGCTRCRAAWPCDEAITGLLAEHGGGLRLSAHLWALFDEAAKVMPYAPAVLLYELCIRRPLDAIEARLREVIS